MAAAASLVMGLCQESPVAGAEAAVSVRSMRWERRIVLFSAPGPSEVALSEQRRLLTSWDGAAERDVSTVEIAGDNVAGSSDSASDLRRWYHLPADHFAVILIGKDGHVALRSTRPITAELLTQTIDAMPMRRAGQR